MEDLLVSFEADSLNRLCSKASSQPIRSFSQISRHFRMKSLDIQVTYLLQMGRRLQIPWISCSQLRASHGVRPCSISQQIRPIDHKSDLAVYFDLLRIWGDMQSGVPTMDFMTAFSSSRLLANPKSLILHTPFFIKILAGLRSLWMMPLLCRYLAPFMICLRYFFASFSGIFFFFSKKWNRSPSSQNSVMMYMLLVVWQMSWSLTIFSWETIFIISISD